MNCNTYKLNELATYKYVVILSKHKGQWVFCKHKKRNTLENAGGHIEAGETPMDAAKRELYEETGAISFDITPIFDYHADDESSSASGMVFFAQIHEFGDLPESEMEEIYLLNQIPTNFTYKEISNELFSVLKRDFQALYNG